MESKLEIAPEVAAAVAASVDSPFTGFFFRAPAEIDPLMQLTHAELKVYLAVTNAIQRDQNGGLLAMSQIAKRANLSERHARKAIEALCQRRLLIRVNRATGAELTRKEDWNGRTVTYANPIQWKQKHTSNLIPAGQRSGPEDDDRYALRNGVTESPLATYEHGPVGEGDLRPVGERYLRPVGQRHSEYSESLECPDFKHAQPQVEPSAFSGLSFERSDGDKLINGFASAKSAEGSPGSQAAAVQTPRTQNQKADAPAKPACAKEENSSMKAKTNTPSPREATDAALEQMRDLLSGFTPTEVMDYETAMSVPNWVVDAALDSAVGASAETVCAFLRQKAAAGWQPPRWSAIPAVIRAAFTPTQKPARARPWTTLELETVRDCGSAYMEGDSPPESFESNCEHAADGHTAADVIAYLELKYAHKRYRPGGEFGPSSWNWFYTVIRGRFSANERGHLPEQPAISHAMHRASAEQLQRGMEVMDGSLVASLICSRCGGELRQYTDHIEATCTCGQAKPTTRAGTAHVPAPGKRRAAGGRQ